MDMDKQQPQDQRLNQMQQPQKPHQQTQHCPRCGSLDTRFCYYNNYKSTQPRYFCKNCKRYWTLGGALRNSNVPITRNISKGKRTTKTTSSTSQLHHHSHTMASPIISRYFYQGGHENLSSMMRPSQLPSHYQSYSNLGHALQPTQFYQMMGNKESDVKSLGKPQGLFMIPSTIANNNINHVSHNDYWPQNFINNRTPDTFFSSTINNSTTCNTERNNSVVDYSPYTPKQWYDFSGYHTLP